MNKAIDISAQSSSNVDNNSGEDSSDDFITTTPKLPDESNTLDTMRGGRQRGDARKPSTFTSGTSKNNNRSNTRDSSSSSPANSDADFISNEESPAAEPTSETIYNTNIGRQGTEQHYCFGTPRRTGRYHKWEWTLVDAIEKAFSNEELMIKKGTYKYQFMATALNRNANTYCWQMKRNKLSTKIPNFAYKGFSRTRNITSQLGTYWPDTQMGNIPTIAQLLEHFTPIQHMSRTSAKESMHNLRRSDIDPYIEKQTKTNKQDQRFSFPTPYRSGPLEKWEVPLLRLIDTVFEDESMGIKPGTSKISVLRTAVNRCRQSFHRIIIKKFPNEFMERSSIGLIRDRNVTSRLETAWPERQRGHIPTIA